MRHFFNPWTVTETPLCDPQGTILRNLFLFLFSILYWLVPWDESYSCTYQTQQEVDFLSGKFHACDNLAKYTGRKNSYSMFFFSKESPFFQTNLKTLTKNLTVYKKKTKGLHGNRMTNNQGRREAKRAPGQYFDPGPFGIFSSTVYF